MSEKINIQARSAEIRQIIKDNLSEHWRLFLAEGVVFIALGVTAISLPGLFSIGIELILGWLLLIGGITQLVRALNMVKMPGFSLWLSSGILQVVIGYFLISAPAQGVMTLTFLLTVFFALDGMAKVYLSYMLYPLARWGGLLLTGISSLAVAILVWAGWHGSSTWVLGLLVGVNMIFIGIALVNISLHHKSYQ
ncbi:HdeD family acid-resistance protein [Methylomonas methanica]|uniref:HdeD family acid-resistance protein n=1 Tax=Methylomonas methanica (strain DSM 25384 / MC09) TaxID=857087 RepID=G0A3B9_METMM|nr:DUF308 domain-containing protein [Methylomonas methanica]AEG00218.1 hypothetical protein Metme_1800 [Methylomonas methanica MC09]